ncbi:hypothetical protein G6689_02375 [Polynucleobacter paneuropaeus]|nr:hypothetical protein G6689_02375 [Polynucleobacter paneuropaeus]
MITFDKYSKLIKKESGYRGPARKGEFLRGPEIILEHPLQKGMFIMNRRNKVAGEEPVSVDLYGDQVNPLESPHEQMVYDVARGIFLDDARTTFDGISIIFQNIPKPIISINNIAYYLVGGIYKNSCKSEMRWDIESKSQYFTTNLSNEFLADMNSLGNPLYGLSPTGMRNYFFGLSEHPIAAFEDEQKSIFSSGGVIAIGTSYHPRYEATRVETQIKILPPSALKLIEKWRQEAGNNVI